MGIIIYGIYVFTVFLAGFAVIAPMGEKLRGGDRALLYASWFFLVLFTAIPLSEVLL